MNNVLVQVEVWLTRAVPDDILTLGFGLGCLFIIVSLQDKFDQILDDKIPEQLRIFRLSQLTEPSKFLFGKYIYLFFIITLYAFLVLAFTRIEDVGILGIDKKFTTSSNTVALYVALVLAGFIPNIKYLNKLEHYFRKLGQVYAGIPSDHAQIFEKIQASGIQIDISNKDIGIDLVKKDVDAIKKLIGAEVFLEFRKCNLILTKLSSAIGSDLEFGQVSVRVRDLFDTILDGIRTKINTTSGNLKQLTLVDNGTEGGDIASTIKRDIRNWFRAISYMLGCAIVADANIKESKVNDVLREFGFETKEIIHSDLVDLLFRSLFFSFVILFFTNILFYLLPNFGFSSYLLPSSLLNGLVLTAQAYIATVICISIFLKTREFFLIRDIWYLNEAKVRVSRLIVAILFSLSVLIVVPYLDYLAGVIEGNPNNWEFHSNPRRYLGNYSILFAYPLSFLSLVIIFIEHERKASRDKKYYRKMYSKKWIIIRTFGVCSVFVLLGFLFASESIKNLIPSKTILDFPFFIIYLASQLIVTSFSFCFFFARQISQRMVP